MSAQSSFGYRGVAKSGQRHLVLSQAIEGPNPSSSALFFVLLWRNW